MKPGIEADGHSPNRGRSTCVSNGDQMSRVTGVEARQVGGLHRLLAAAP